MWVQAAARRRQAQEQQQPLLPECACLVTCMLLRAAYGGLGGDVAMLKEFAALWAARCVLNGCSMQNERYKL